MKSLAPLTLLLCALFGTACEGLGGSDSTPQLVEKQEISPMEEARQLEQSGKRVKAYQLYRNTLEQLPPGDARRPELANKVKQLAFILGVPDGSQTKTHNLPPNSAEENRQPAIQQAQKLYLKAQSARQNGNEQLALTTYDQVLKTISEADAAELYWNAYQARDELSPQVNEAIKYAPDPNNLDDSSLAALSEKGLSVARQHFTEAKSLIQAGQLKPARIALRSALESLQGADDPQLELSIQESLHSVEQKLNPVVEE